MPKVSVIIPSYNRGNFIEETINSVLNQTFNNFEILVVDDGSTDNTKEIVSKIKDERLKYIYKENGGVSSARNLGMTKAAGKFICFLDSDDLWPENFLEIMTTKLENSEYGAACCMRTRLFDNGRRQPSYQEKLFSSGQMTLKIFSNTFIQTSTLCFKREVLEGIFFDVNLTRGEDVDVWLKVSTRTNFLFVPDFQIIYRQSGERSFDVKHCNRVRVLERFYFKLGGNKYVPHHIAMHKLSKAYRSAGKKAIKAGCRKAAIDLLKRAINYQKFQIRIYFDLLKAYRLSDKNDKMPNWQMSKPLEINDSFRVN